MSFSRFALVLGLSVSAFACSQSADESSTSVAAQTGPSIEPGPTMSVSDEGVGAVGTLLHEARIFQNDPTSAYAAPFKTFHEASYSDVAVDQHGTHGVTYYFTGDVLVEGDIIDHTVQLVVDETFGGEWGPSYQARLGNGNIPDSAHRLVSTDLQAFNAVLGLEHLAAAAPTDPAAIEFRKFADPWTYMSRIDVRHLTPTRTQFLLTADVVEGGDMIVGNASLAVIATESADPEYHSVAYEAAATVVNPYPETFPKD